MILACATATGGPLDGQPPGPSISAITYERLCFGCPSERVVFRRDGPAARTVLGNLREGLPDVAYAGTQPARDFEALARLLVEQGFFDLDAEYANPRLADGQQITVTVTRQGREVAVRERNRAGPPALRTVVDALEHAARAVSWRPQ